MLLRGGPAGHLGILSIWPADPRSRSARTPTSPAAGTPMPPLHSRRWRRAPSLAAANDGPAGV